MCLPVSAHNWKVKLVKSQVKSPAGFTSLPTQQGDLVFYHWFNHRVMPVFYL